MVTSYGLGENFADSARKNRKKIAIESKQNPEKQTLTYSELLSRVEALASYLAVNGVKQGDKVSIILPNGPDWPVIFFALSYLGSIAVPLDPAFSEKDIRNIIDDSGAKFVYTSDKDRKLATFLSNLNGVDKVITPALRASGETRNEKYFKPLKVKPDNLMVILYTSGTTDLPKGVMLTHKNLYSNYNSLKALNIFSPKDVILSVLPLYHSYAMMATMILPIFLGAKIVYAPEDWPEKLRQYIKESRTSIFIGVPQIFHMMHNRMTRKRRETDSFKARFFKILMRFGVVRVFGRRLRFFVSGGAKLDKKVTGEFLKLGFKILEGYGLTETSPVASLCPVNKIRPGSIGHPIPDVKMTIKEPDNNGIGNIAIKGPNVMKGYYNKPDKTEEVLKDGWFLSGDLGYKDGDGYFYITGRLKEVIVLSSGKNIYPEEVEKQYSQVLQEH